MKSQARVVVIGGGLIGCSILYHLTKLGWSDVVLLERDELTSGSTWHAAANIHGLHDSNNISRLQYYTMKLYKELEAETGQSCGVHRTGSIYLASSKDRMHQLKLQAAKARYYGTEFYEIGVDQINDLHPLVNTEGLHCAMFEADGGRVDPSGVTHAYAKGARQNGAEIYRFTAVEETNAQPDGSWEVVTNKGTIKADVVVNAAGLWGREVGRMAGLDLPLQPTEHQYFVTETIPEIAAMAEELPSIADRDGEFYLRQEGQGLLVGAYEKDMRFWAEQSTPMDFGHELLPDDLDRIMENVMRACYRVPVLESAGVSRVINGPMIWSPDAAALFGPAPELKNYFCCNGIIPGFSQSGGLGSLLAQWIVEGETELDLFPWDMARYGTWANKTFTQAKVQDAYSHRFKIHFPYEERDAGRPLRVRPAYERQKELGAVFGLNYGWEHPLWFAAEGEEAKEDYGFERQDWFHPVARECRTLRENVGVIDVSNFAKYEIKGPGARQWLDSVLANRMPTEIGRSCLSPLLGVRGGIAGDFTVTLLAEDHYYMVGSGMAERYHKRFFDAVPLPAETTFQSITEAYAGFNVAGPKARDLLSRLSNEDLSNEAFRFMRSRVMTVAGLDARVLRVSFTGDLGWEVYVKEADQLALYNALLDAGKDLGVVPVGGRSLLSLRLEKGYGSWSREYSPEYWPQEVGLDRLIKLDKGDFLGKEAYLALKDKAPREKLVCMEIQVGAADGTTADATGGEPIFLPDGTPVGRVSSGSYGHWVGKSLALGFVKTDHAEAGQELSVAVLGQDHKGVILAEAAFDPKGERLRG